MGGRIAYEVVDDAVVVVLRPKIGAPSHMRVEHDEAVRFARSLLEDLGAGDGLGEGGRRITLGRIAVDTGEMQLFVGGRSVRLTGKEFATIEALALRPGATITKETIYRRLYPAADDVELKIVDVFICKIRNKLRPFGCEAQIETVWGRGYRIVAEPERALGDAKGRPATAQAAILERLAQGDASWTQLVSECGTAKKSAANALRWLVDRGDVERVGGVGSGVYSLARPLSEAAA
jgi:DNA-binding winged helix-turn-helix (wHTH) protein